MRSSLSFYVATCLTAFLLASCGPPASQAQLQAGWQIVETEGEYTPRSENALAEVDGKLYLVGGRGMQPVDVYDPETSTWSSGTGAPIEIHHFQAVEYDGKIYVVGAWTGGFPTEQGITHVLIYDPEEDAWTTGPEIPEPRRRGAAGAVVYDDHIYVVSGNRGGHGPHATAVTWLDRLDPRAGTWDELADAPHRRDHFQAAVVDDKLYAVGGRTSDIEGFIDSTVAAVDVYDFSSDTWSTVPDAPIPTQRAGAGTAAFGEHIFVSGGEGFGEAWGETEAFDTSTGTWEFVDMLNRPRHGIQMVLFDDRLWVAGGAGAQGGGPEVEEMEMMDLSN
ncbi:MAG: DUF1668 domain-containing protein [Rhodothermales bacterium]